MSVDTDTISRPSTRLYVWTVEGEPAAGTLAEYANDVQQGHYSDVEVGPLHVIVIVEVPWGLAPVLVEAQPERTITEGPDFRHIVLSHDDQDATYRIDLRA